MESQKISTDINRIKQFLTVAVPHEIPYHNTDKGVLWIYYITKPKHVSTSGCTSLMYGS